MKLKILFMAACLASGIYLIFKLNSKKESRLITGNWMLDSVKTGADSNLIYFMLLSSMKDDSSEVDFRFTKDTLFTFASGESDTSKYRFNTGKKEVTIENDEMEVYQLNRINDSVISLTAKDSTALFLKKLSDVK